MFRTALIVAALSTVASTGFAHEYSTDGVTVDHPWARATPGGAKLGAGYATITNTGDKAITLTGGESPVATRVEIHDMEMTDGVMRMRALSDGLMIAPGETVELAPGGKHIMLMGLKEPLPEGETRPITLNFDGAASLEVFMMIEGMAARGSSASGDMKMDHGEMKHDSMDHDAMKHETMDHGSMDHGSMNHDEMDHAAPKE